jgi:hypothetical protein
MKPIVRFLAVCIALVAAVASQAGDPSANPIARRSLDFQRCKNHFILSAPDPCAITPDASWVATSDMHEARTRHTATLLKDGTVLVAGGGVASAELYDPRDGSWTMTGPLSHVWGGQTAILLPSGKVLVLGNMMPSMVPVPIDNSAEIYDPATRQWTNAEGMQIPRVLFTATLLDTGKVLVVGGDGNDDQTVAAAELYEPETNSWAFTGNSTGVFWHTATKLRDGRVLIAGGTRDDFISATVTRSELYDPATGAFVFAGDMQIARGMHVATLLDDGSVLVTGGFLRDCPGGGCDFFTLANAERYDPSAGRWFPAGIQNVARMSHTATLLPDQTVLLTGGDLSGGNVPGVTYSTLQNSELSDRDATSWGHGMSTRSPRADHTATLLPDGTVLVAGGRQTPNYGNAQPLKSAELYAPITSK